QSRVDLNANPPLGQFVAQHLADPEAATGSVLWWAGDLANGNGIFFQPPQRVDNISCQPGQIFVEGIFGRARRTRGVLGRAVSRCSFSPSVTIRYAGRPLARADLISLASLSGVSKNATTRVLIHSVRSASTRSPGASIAHRDHGASSGSTNRNVGMLLRT